MLNVFDVAYHILSIVGTTTAMKLQKLVYYSQAWSLVWDSEPLFQEKIEAWVSGPVVRELYNKHRGMFDVSVEDILPKHEVSELTVAQKETINNVVSFYNKYNSQQLSDLTHKEDPWKIARSGLSPNERGDVEIKLSDMEEYYSSLS